jgi:hypothetical protein
MDYYELIAIIKAAKEVKISFVEGMFRLELTQHDGQQHIFITSDLPRTIHNIYDTFIVC